MVCFLNSAWKIGRGQRAKSWSQGSHASQGSKDNSMQLSFFILWRLFLTQLHIQQQLFLLHYWIYSIHIGHSRKTVKLQAFLYPQDVKAVWYTNMLLIFLSLVRKNLWFISHDYKCVKLSSQWKIVHGDYYCIGYEFFPSFNLYL